MGNRQGLTEKWTLFAEKVKEAKIFEKANPVVFECREVFFNFFVDKAMATHSSVLAWRIPGTGEPGGLSSIGSQSRTRLKRLSSSSSSSILYWCFSFWLTSLCIIGSSFIHLIRTDSNAFFFNG